MADGWGDTNANSDFAGGAFGSADIGGDDAQPEPTQEKKINKKKLKEQVYAVLSPTCTITDCDIDWSPAARSFRSSSEIARLALWFHATRSKMFQQMLLLFVQTCSIRSFRKTRTTTTSSRATRLMGTNLSLIGSSSVQPSKMWSTSTM